MYLISNSCVEYSVTYGYFENNEINKFIHNHIMYIHYYYFFICFIIKLSMGVEEDVEKKLTSIFINIGKLCARSILEGNVRTAVQTVR